MRARPRIRTLAVLAGAAALLIAAAAFTVNAQPGRMHRGGTGACCMGAGGGMGPGGCRMGPGGGMGAGAGCGHGPLMAARDHLFAAIDRLDLTEAQKTKLQEIRRRAVGVLMPKKQAVIEARMDLHDLMAQEKLDAAAARKAHEKLVRARDELQAAAFDLRLQAREVLTPEQLKQLREFRGPRKQLRIEKEKRMGFEF